MVTVIFAVYAAAVLAALLLAGRSSDQAGRRPVLAGPSASSALSTSRSSWLPTSGAPRRPGPVRAVGRPDDRHGDGRADRTGPASAGRWASLAATAANMGGLGLGPLVAGLFAQYAPHPTTLVFEVYLAVLAVAALSLRLVPEMVEPASSASLRFAGLGLPERGRGQFLAAVVAGFAAFGLLGLFSALAPAFLGSIMHQDSHAVQGAVVFAKQYECSTCTGT